MIKIGDVFLNGGAKKLMFLQSVNMYKPWIFYHLGPTFFVWSWTQATWLPKTRRSTSNATAEFLPLRSKAWNKPYQSLRWSGSKFGSDTHFTCSQCAPKNTPKDFWWLQFQPLHHCSAQPGRKKLASVQNHPWSLQIEVILMSLLFAAWCLYMFAATPRFARSQSCISFDMLKSFRRV